MQVQSSDNSIGNGGGGDDGDSSSGDSLAAPLIFRGSLNPSASPHASQDIGGDRAASQAIHADYM